MGISDDIKPKKTYHLSKEIQRKPAEAEKPDNSSVDSQDDEVEIKRPEDQERKLSPEARAQMEDDFFSGFHKPKAHHKKDLDDEKPPRKHSCLGRIFTIIIILALAATLIYQNRDLIINFFNPKSDSSSESSSNTADENYVGEKPVTESTTVTPAETTTPETTAAPNIDKASVTIEVLNGNGLKGSADTVRDALVTAGFKVAKVANAAKFSYTSTIIYYKTGKEAEATSIKENLSSRTCTLELSDTIAKSYDVVVVVGKN